MRSLLSLTALLVLVGVAAGCGDDNNSTPDMTMKPEVSARPADTNNETAMPEKVRGVNGKE